MHFFPFFKIFYLRLAGSPETKMKKEDAYTVNTSRKRKAVDQGLKFASICRHFVCHMN